MEDLNKQLITIIENKCGLDNRRVLSRCKELLIAGADPNYKHVDNFFITHPITYTPLYLASFKENYELCELLLEYGANINDSSCKENALYNACNTGNYKLCKLFIDRGADINILTNYGDTVLEGAMMCGCFHYKDEDILKICKLLIDNGINLLINGVKITDKTDRYRFHMIYHANKYDRKHVYEYIENEIKKME
jgi:ankyrin repeat protein